MSAKSVLLSYSHFKLPLYLAINKTYWTKPTDQLILKKNVSEPEMLPRRKDYIQYQLHKTKSFRIVYEEYPQNPSRSSISFFFI